MIIDRCENCRVLTKHTQTTLAKQIYIVYIYCIFHTTREVLYMFIDGTGINIYIDGRLRKLKWQGGFIGEPKWLPLKRIENAHRIQQCLLTSFSSSSLFLLPHTLVSLKNLIYSFCWEETGNLSQLPNVFCTDVDLLVLRNEIGIHRISRRRVLFTLNPPCLAHSEKC